MSVHADKGAIEGKVLFEIGGLVAKRADEDAVGVDFRLGLEQNARERLGRQAVPVEVGVGEHHDEIVVGVLFGYLADGVFGCFERVIYDGRGLEISLLKEGFGLECGSVNPIETQSGSKS